MDKRALIMAGGTGGHVFPALAVADVLARRGFAVEWLGTQIGIESELVPRAGLVLNAITITGVRGKGLMSWIKLPWRLLFAIFQAMKVIQKLNPQVIVGFGGFASGPGGIASWLLHKPLVIHEQNAIVGTTNRWLARVAKRKLEAFPNSLSNAQLVGNPVRESITKLAEPKRRYDESRDQLHLLVLGGSLGALKINQLMPVVVAGLTERLTKPVRVWHQTGRKHFTDTQAAYQNYQVDAKVVPFVDDMAAAYGWADLIVCRAGALTVAEIAATGVASLLIPFPYAIDDHQTKNAQWLTTSGAAVLAQEANLDVVKLQELLVGLLSDYSGLREMAERARSMRLPQAAEKVADACEEVLCE